MFSTENIEKSYCEKRRTSMSKARSGLLESTTHVRVELSDGSVRDDEVCRCVEPVILGVERLGCHQLRAESSWRALSTYSPLS